MYVNNHLYEYICFHLVRRCLVVLMCIPNDQQGNRIVLSLYTEKNKNFVRYLLLETGDRLNDRCRKLIEGKTGLFFMELVFQRNDKGEIFGARSVSERKVNSSFNQIR